MAATIRMFIRFIAFSSGRFFISCPSLWFLIYCFCRFSLSYAQARSEPNLRMVDDDGGILMKVFKLPLNFSELF